MDWRKIKLATLAKRLLLAALAWQGARLLLTSLAAWPADGPPLLGFWAPPLAPALHATALLAFLVSLCHLAARPFTWTAGLTALAAWLFAASLHVPPAFISFQLVPLTLFALILDESDDRASPVSRAMPFLLFTLYFFAAFHKALTFGDTWDALPRRMARFLTPEFAAIFSEGGFFLSRIIPATVIPFEAALAFAYLWPRTRLLAVAAALVFHLSLTFVSQQGLILTLLLFAMHFYALQGRGAARLGEALQPKPLRRALLWSGPLFLFSAIAAGAAWGVDAFLRFAGALVAVYVFLPLLFGCPASPSPARNSWRQWAACAFFFLYGLAPTLGGYRWPIEIGWTMFSGSYQWHQPRHTITVTNPQGCVNGQTQRYFYAGAIYRGENPGPGLLRFYSPSAVALEKWREYLERRCGAATP